MPNLAPMEILVVLIVALIVLGPKRLPEAGRQVGRAMAEVRRWSQSMQAEVKSVLEDDLEAPPPAPWTPPPPAVHEDPPPTPVDADAPAADADGVSPAPGGTASGPNDPPTR